MFQFEARRLLVILFVAVGLIGCSTTQMAVYPMRKQGKTVQQSTRGGYGYLQSRKGESVVTVSLRGATPQYMKAYVSVAQKGSNPVQIHPTAVTIVDSASGNTFSGYAPEEVPAVVQRVAQQSTQTVMSLDRFGVDNTRLLVTGRGEETRGYGSSDENDTSYLDFMLRGKTLSKGTATSGLVFTPFNTNMSSFRMKVPVGQTMHTFRFTVQSIGN